MSRIERSNEKYQRSKTKLDNDGYPDLPKEPAVTIPSAQYEALIAAVKVYRKFTQYLVVGWTMSDTRRQEIEKTDTALRAAGIQIEET